MHFLSQEDLAEAMECVKGLPRCRPCLPVVENKMLLGKGRCG